MPRDRLKPGEWGVITCTKRGTSHVAKARIRDKDGKLRPVEAAGSSADDARRRLQSKLVQRVAPTRDTDGQLTTKSTISQLAAYWLTEKESTIGKSTHTLYKYTWESLCLPALGDLRVTEATTGTIDAFLRSVAKRAPSRARTARIVLTGMFGTAVRLDLLDHNPTRETSRTKSKKKPVRSVTLSELDAIRNAVADYCRHESVRPDGSVVSKYGPKPGVDLPDQINLLAATGVRISELLSLTWADIDLNARVPVAVVRSTLIQPRAAGEKLDRQPYRKGGGASTHHRPTRVRCGDTQTA